MLADVEYQLVVMLRAYQISQRFRDRGTTPAR
jgi:hypothetical protein